ncbi:MAG: nucleotidyltransferase domain-containing protein [Leptolyngbyaceae cyanobacterium MAG.088]|nr:nucleotidyltransferase domain-containing protein [Leptolyngbyaceae cyanobacterium MAG.088]
MTTDVSKTRNYPVSNSQRAKILARIQADRANKVQRLEAMRHRQQLGMEIAKQAAQILKEQFQVKRVVVFGSLLNVESMHEHSDIDIAVWGLADDQLLSAWSTLDTNLDFQAAFPYIDLVPAEKAFPYIQNSIEKTHLEL